MDREPLLYEFICTSNTPFQISADRQNTKTPLLYKSLSPHIPHTVPAECELH